MTIKCIENAGTPSYTRASKLTQLRLFEERTNSDDDAQENMYVYLYNNEVSLRVY